MSNIFDTYVTPQIKEINHPVFLQEWKLNIDSAEYERNMGGKLYINKNDRTANFVGHSKLK